MNTALEQLIFIGSIFTIALALILTSIRLFFKIRRQFPIRVNCWFCNECSWVPYDDRNQWNCPKCEQYNGFTKDGDYNRELVAQFSQKLNKTPPRRSTGSSPDSSHNLCESCNRNQELKVQQLASFVASDERVFDEEIQDYHAQLEDAYRLCPSCEVTLKRKLNKVKGKILGSKLLAQRRRVPNKAFNQRVERNYKEKLLKLVESILTILLFIVTYYLLYRFTRKSEIFTIDIGFDFLGKYVKLLLFLWDADRRLRSYAVAMSMALLFIHMKRKSNAIGTVILNLVSWSTLTILDEKKVLKDLVDVEFLDENSFIFSWTLYTVTSVTGLAIFLVHILKLDSDQLENVNESFHKIECDLDDMVDEELRVHNNSGSETDKRQTFTQMEDLISQKSGFSSKTRLNSSFDEDEEIRSISLNSSRGSALNKSDPGIKCLYDNNHQSGFRSIYPNSVSSSNLYGPAKTFREEDLFSTSIRGLNIGDLAKATVNNPLVKNNPFMKDINVARSNAQSLYDNYNSACHLSSRSLLTPSRLSLISEGPSSLTSPSTFTNSWLAGGFWNQHQQINTQQIFTAKPINSFPTFSEKDQLTDKFKPIIDSRSSSQSSGFESRQSTGSVCNQSLPVNGFQSMSREGSVFNDRQSLFSEPLSFFNDPTLSRNSLYCPQASSLAGSRRSLFLRPDALSPR